MLEKVNLKLQIKLHQMPGSTVGTPLISWALDLKSQQKLDLKIQQVLLSEAAGMSCSLELSLNRDGFLTCECMVSLAVRCKLFNNDSPVTGGCMVSWAVSCMLLWSCSLVSAVSTRWGSSF